MFEINLLHLFSMSQVQECGKPLVMNPETSMVILPIVRRQNPIFWVKCAISGNNHFFAFFICSWYVDEIWPEWEVAIGLAFSESKMAANIQHTVYLDVSFILDIVEM